MIAPPTPTATRSTDAEDMRIRAERNNHMLRVTWVSKIEVECGELFEFRTSLPINLAAINLDGQQRDLFRLEVFGVKGSCGLQVSVMVASDDTYAVTDDVTGYFDVDALVASVYAEYRQIPDKTGDYWLEMGD